MPVQVAAATGQAQFDLRIAAQQLQQFYENNQDAIQGTFSALGQILNGGLTGILGLIELSGGAALLNYANFEDGSLSGAAAAAAATDLLAVGSATVVAGSAVVNQGVKGLFEQQFYAALQGGGQSSIKTFGQDLKNIREVATGRLKGFSRGNTTLPRGDQGARDLFEKLTGTPPTGDFDRAILQDGREIVFRAISRSGPAKIEVVDPLQSFLEKISFP
ncbi:hypothetical protein [Anthocerotibacter panamensis]|uniref:hypothetical protein n=1 Tax=Anthocerotibacter panamensis TaxID=2857077 RepID=UPI001C4026A3|nr:hypothetical protein [Anthocerotibacter panamensis]